MNWASLILRLGLGIMFMAHGSQKAFGLFNGPGIAGFSNMLSDLGLTPAIFWAYVATAVELIGGLFLILGFLTRITSFLLILLMSVAIMKVHLANGFFMSRGGFEYNFIIICSSLALIIIGAGKFSLNDKL